MHNARMSILVRSQYKVVGRGGFGKVNAVVRRDPITGESRPTELFAMKRQEKARIMKKQASRLLVAPPVLIAASLAGVP